MAKYVLRLVEKEPMGPVFDSARLAKLAARERGEGRYCVLRIVEEFELSSQVETTFSETRLDQPTRRRKPVDIEAAHP